MTEVVFWDFFFYTINKTAILCLEFESRWEKEGISNGIPYRINLHERFKTAGNSFLGHSYTASQPAIRQKYRHVREMKALYSVPTLQNS